MIVNTNRILLSFVIMLICHFYSAQENKLISDSANYSKTNDINEIIINGRRKKQYADKAVYTFDKNSIKNARHSKDLLTAIPRLKIDIINNTIGSSSGGKILFLINGIESSDVQMLGILPENVIRVEYYDIPPARWATKTDFVVNIITRNPEKGYGYGSDIWSSITTGFVNGSAYGNYSKGKSDLGIEYSINFRDYDSQFIKNRYEYILDGKSYESDGQQRKYMGYNNQNIALRYTNVSQNEYQFQAKINLFLHNGFQNGKGESSFTVDKNKTLDEVIQNYNRNFINPNLDFYFSKNLGKKDELNANVIWYSYKTNSYEFKNEFIKDSQEEIFKNEMNLKAIQSGFTGEVAHIHNFDAGKLNSGYKLSGYSVSNSINNLLGFSENKINYREQYFYSEFSGKKNRFMYRLGAGFQNIYNKNEENTTNQWNIAPKSVFSYQINDSQSIRFTGEYSSKNPEGSMLSNNLVQKSPNIVKRGNPFLKPESIWQNKLMYSLRNSYYDVTLSLSHKITNNAIGQYFKNEESLGGYALTYENAKNMKEYAVEMSGTVKPFGNNYLTLKIYAKPTRETIESNSGSFIKNDYIANFFSISSEYKSFFIEYQFNVPVFSLDGDFLDSNENARNLFSHYKYKNWTFKAGILFIGFPAQYFSKSIDQSLVLLRGEGKIFDNKSMFILGLSYNFSNGNKIDLDRKINNKSAPVVDF